MSKNSVHYLDLENGDIIISNGKIFKVGKDTTIEPLAEERKLSICLDGKEVNIMNLDAKKYNG